MRKIFEVVVDKVDLVSKPANMEEFILIKNQDGKEENPDGGGTTTSDATAQNNSSVPVHNALVSETISVMENLAKYIQEEASKVDITNDDALWAFREKIYDLCDLSWKLCDYKSIVSLAKEAKEDMDKKDVPGVMKKIAKMMKVVGETSQQKSKIQKEDGSSAYVPQSKMEVMDEAKVQTLIEGLTMIAQAIQGVPVSSLKEMAMQLFGKKEEQDPPKNPDATTEDVYKQNLEKLEKQYQDSEKRVSELEKIVQKYEKGAGSIQQANGSSRDGSPKRKEDDRVIWGDDLSVSWDERNS